MSASDRCMTIICHSAIRLDWTWFFNVFCLLLKLTVHSLSARRFTSCLVSAPTASFTNTVLLFAQFSHIQFIQLVFQAPSLALSLSASLSPSHSFSLSPSVSHSSIFFLTVKPKQNKNQSYFIVNCDNGSTVGVMLHVAYCILRWQDEWAVARANWLTARTCCHANFCSEFLQHFAFAFGFALMSNPEAKRVFNALWWQEIVWIVLDSMGQNTHIDAHSHTHI